MGLLMLFDEFTEAVECVGAELELEPLNSLYIVELSFAAVEKDFYVLILVDTHHFVVDVHLFCRKASRLLKAFKRDAISEENVVGLLS